MKHHISEEWNPPSYIFSTVFISFSLCLMLDLYSVLILKSSGKVKGKVSLVFNYHYIMKIYTGIRKHLCAVFNF